MEQTAVEWLEEQTRKPEWHSLKRQDIFEQAKEMEEKEKIKAKLEVLMSIHNKHSASILSEKIRYKIKELSDQLK
jgi:hypothetical protein